MWIAGMRWSYSDRAWCGLFRVLDDGRALCRHELTWRRKTPEVAAIDLRDFCETHHIALTSVVAQADIFPKAHEIGETVSETFIRAGLPMRAGSTDRLACWSRLRSWLEPTAHGPSLLIHADCKYLIRTLPTLVEAESESDDVADTPEEYPAMGTALFCMSRPLPLPKVVDDTPKIGTWGHELRHVLHPSTRRVLGGDLVQRS